MGLPLTLDGTRGPQAEKVLAFVEALAARRWPVPVVTCDERLTTVEAEQALREAGWAGSRERKAVVDQVAAVLILQELPRRATGRGRRRAEARA